MYKLRCVGCMHTWQGCRGRDGASIGFIFLMLSVKNLGNTGIMLVKEVLRLVLGLYLHYKFWSMQITLVHSQ